MKEKIVHCYQILGLPPGTIIQDVFRRCIELEAKFDPDRLTELRQKQEAFEARRRIKNAANWLLEFQTYGTSRLCPVIPDEQFELGSRYLAWAIDKSDYAEAVKQFRKAAEQGHLNAQFTLWEIYGHGMLLTTSAGSLWRPPGIPQDKAEAYKWLVLAAINGHSSASMNVEDPHGLTSEEIREGQRRAEEFMVERPWFRKSELRKGWDKLKRWLSTPNRPYVL